MLTLLSGTCCTMCPTAAYSPAVSHGQLCALLVLLTAEASVPKGNAAAQAPKMGKQQLGSLTVIVALALAGSALPGPLPKQAGV